MHIIGRIKRKLALWRKFRGITNNFFQIWIYRVLTMAGLNLVFPYNAVIRLRNGTGIAYGNQLDVSAVPVTVEIWRDKKYNPPGFIIDPADTVFDIGGNIGSFALYAATFTRGPIYCIEPMPDNIQRIKRNINLNNLTNIVPVEAAAANAEGQMELHVSAVGATHSLFKPVGDTGKKIMVQSLNIESFCRTNSIAQIGFMKMDCEGAEYDIILNWSETFARSIKQLVLEYHQVPGHHYNELMDFLAKSGFSVAEYDGQYISARH